MHQSDQHSLDFSLALTDEAMLEEGDSEESKTLFKLYNDERREIYCHDLKENVSSFHLTHRELSQPSRYRFHACDIEHVCDQRLMLYDAKTDGRIDKLPFIVICKRELSFNHIPNYGYRVGFNCVYLIAMKEVTLDIDYDIGELYDMYLKKDILLAYGGLSYSHCGHLMTEDVYNSYRHVKWCCGGCGGCPDNWDYINPESIYKIFPTFKDMKDYETRAANYIFNICHE